MNSRIINKIRKKIQLDKEIALQKVLELIAAGVSVENPEQLHIRGVISCGENVKFDSNVIIEGNVKLEDGVLVGANSILKDCTIGKGTTINPFSLVEGAVIGENCLIGPYGRIRQGVSIEDRVQIGNFVEIKNSNIASKCRINHLSFVGDADLAEQVTIGAGTITCNHDGVGINRTLIEQGAYVGSGCNLVAPLKINTNATIASGSTITKEVSADTLTIARSRQVKIENWKGPKLRK
jgi:bifunctional UDP-N-acetylglucosamine pyrophosphorylase / glucosamine-1-phosphate N-acetyltransferase